MADISREALDVLVYSQRDRMVEAERCARDLQTKLRRSLKDLEVSEKSREWYIQHCGELSRANAKLRRGHASLRGHITRLRRKLKAVPDA